MFPKRSPPAIVSPCSKRVGSVSRELRPSSPPRTIALCEALATISSHFGPASRISTFSMKQSNIDLSVGAFVLLGIAAIVWFAVEAGAGVAIRGGRYEDNAMVTKKRGV